MESWELADPGIGESGGHHTPSPSWTLDIGRLSGLEPPLYTVVLHALAV
jgi:hypothetical protein